MDMAWTMACSSLIESIVVEGCGGAVIRSVALLGLPISIKRASGGAG